MPILKHMAKSIQPYDITIQKKYLVLFCGNTFSIYVYI